MCLFCKIVAKEIPSKIVFENNNFLAFEDISPKAPIHILAIPKEHSDSFDNFDSASMAGMSDFIKQVAKEKDLSNGYRIITNIGDEGGQEVHHLHFHILGGAKLKWPSLI
jgi:histidine triad (HIT) family protein